jgi:AcrR family transcriptional regulator
MDFINESELTKGQRTALKILEAAGRCVAQIGAEKTSISAIAKEASLKRSLIAYHFPKKDDIFYKVMEHIMYQFGRYYLPSRATKPTIENSVEWLIEGYMDYFHAYPHYFHCYLHCFYLSSVHHRYKQLNTKILRRIILRIMVFLRAHIRQEGIEPKGQDLEDFSRLLYSNLVGSIMTYYTAHTNTSYAQFKLSCLKILRQEIKIFISVLRAAEQSQKK